MITLQQNAIVSTDSGAKQGLAATSHGNITITGSGASQLYGVNADSLAGIATGTILVSKTANGSLVDVGSANISGANSLGPIAAQNGNTSNVNTPNVNSPGGPPAPPLPVAVLGVTLPDIFVADDIQVGTGKLVSPGITLPLLVGTVNAPVNGTAHNFTPTTTPLPSFVGVTEVDGTVIPKVLIYKPESVTVNK